MTNWPGIRSPARNTLTGLAVAALASAVAHAQERSGSLEEIVVTARKQEESLLDVNTVATSIGARRSA